MYFLTCCYTQQGLIHTKGVSYAHDDVKSSSYVHVLPL